MAPSALRYYDEVGLLRPTKRASGRRLYSSDAVGIVGAILFLRDAGFTLNEIKRMVSRRSSAPRRWRALAERKLVELDGTIAKAQAARVAIEHGLACPQENLLECPNFWRVVGGLLEGRSLADVHTHKTSVTRVIE